MKILVSIILPIVVVGSVSGDVVAIKSAHSFELEEDYKSSHKIKQ